MTPGSGKGFRGGYDEAKRVLGRVFNEWSWYEATT